ncbi:uncharacterized protein LOC141647582 isoform X2 [Silene latifolia]|uniref:uncharacterized protein LOC141647582 isoform X2 n=1 Tax=Silene latifolia TaxID=37657 RepID=UPI003D7754F4
MLTANSATTQPSHHSKHGFRKPLQPRNIIIFPNSNSNSTQITKSPKKCQINNSFSFFPINNDHSNKENFRVLANPVETIDASLAEELTAVRLKMERLRLDREKTEKLLEEREKFLDFQLYELEERGELQRELEMEVDRLFRLNQLKHASMKMSPIPLREKAMEKKKNKEGLFESARTEESKVESVGGRSTTESTSLSMDSTIMGSPSTSIESIAESVISLAKVELRKFI